jgi:ABC-2 type transport system ATP-binding protein
VASMGTTPREHLAGASGLGAGAAAEVVSLCKRYGMVEAVKDVSFSIERGEVFAFLGPNGAGKTTTVRMLCTLTRPGGGQARVAGSMWRASRRRCGAGSGWFSRSRPLMTG